MMKIKFLTVCLVFLLTEQIFAQTISREELIFLTSEWKGRRFEDGRPKIPDELINRARNIGIVILSQGFPPSSWMSL
jgi:hypothetical protein